jgi:hypothetical protein
LQKSLSYNSSKVLIAFDLAVSHSRFQKMVFPEGISYTQNEGFGTTRLGLIYELNRTFGTRKSPLVDCSLVDWNQIVAELRQWEKIKQGFNLVS